MYAAVRQLEIDFFDKNINAKFSSIIEWLLLRQLQDSLHSEILPIAFLLALHKIWMSGRYI